MPDSPPNRRSFLRWLQALFLGNWLRGLGSVTGLTALGTFLFSWKQPPALDEQRYPLWHPQCSGFHSSTGVLVRQQFDETHAREVRLRGITARVWCLCGGVLTEVEVARTLSTEQGLSLPDAQRRVAGCLQPLYRAGYLVPASAAVVALNEIHEVECPPGAGEALCRQLTS